MPKTHIFCYASGHVVIGGSVPVSGAIPIGEVEDHNLPRFKAHCRVAYNNHDLLIPGIPEAPNDTAALDVLQRFTARMRELNIFAPL